MNFMKPVQFCRGNYIYKQSGHLDLVYFIKSGEVELSKWIPIE